MSYFRTSPSLSVRSDEKDGSESHQLTSGQAVLSRRTHSLSPLDRISSLLPQDVVRQEQDGEADIQAPASEPLEETQAPSSPEEGRRSPSHPGERGLMFGEFLMAEHRKNRVQYRKMFHLQEGGRLLSSYGVIPHNQLAGHPAGRFVKTNRGIPIFIRRPSLEDFVQNMKRGPAITYPKVENVDNPN
uniref:tRNA (adenine(58)-N(1))-methyltransferase n=1 Tax=Nothobranchius kuhntae TaxID=321403 RepID=A0A1A8K4A9_NOTKU